MFGPHPVVSIVIPVFNEEDGIAQLKQKLLRLNDLLSERFELELVFVDDGSRDRTVLVLIDEFNHTGLRYKIVEHGVNRGVGAAFRSGFQQSSGSFICTIDADCSYSPDGLRQLLAALQSSRADIAVASPYHPDGGVEGVPGWRLLLSKGCSLLYRMVCPVKLYTYTSIFRAYRADVVRNVRFESAGFVSAPEILIAAARRGYTITEVPLVLRGRAIGRSKMKIARTIGTHLSMLFGFLLPSSKPGAATVAVMARKELGNARMAPGDNKDPFAA
jgi:dolichol-phosphate mannosyltransferase